MSNLEMLQKELAEIDFFSQFHQEPEINQEALNYAKEAGLLSFADIREKQLNDQIWAFFHKREDSYYNEKRVSYSFLKHLENVRIGKSSFMKSDFKPFVLGRCFEDMFTDRFNVNRYLDLTADELTMVSTWCETAKCDANIKAVYIDSVPEIQKEHNKVWNGLNWKCKTDAELSNEVFDLKTTSAKTEKEFLQACEKFGYFGQGYVYLELTGAKAYTLFGVSKKVNEVFTIQLSKEQIEAGKEEVERLLTNIDHFGIRKEFEG